MKFFLTFSAVVFVTLVFAVFGDAKVTLHFLPHTHDDVGWLKTPSQYLYGLNNTIQNAHVNAIITSIVGSLAADPTRKFTYVEMYFFHGWWIQQPESQKQVVRKLVAEDRLQFACGGWTMPDEASAFVNTLIDQYTIGHRFLMKELNATVKTGWQLDPFGHASYHTIMNAQMGFDAVYFARMSYDEYDWRASSEVKGREFWWYPSKSLPNVGLFGGSLLDQTYCEPTGFQWDLLSELGSCFQNSECDTHQFIVNPPAGSIDDEMPQNNAKMYLDRAVAMAERFSAQTRGEDIMLTMGCDFQQSDSALNFGNMDKIIEIINKDGRMNAKYSTPHEYTQDKISKPDEFPQRDNDIFPYQDAFSVNKGHNWWSGYFTSRPALKRYIRQVSSYWNAARQMRGLYLAPDVEISIIAQALGIATHHDAVAGTAKQHVAFWYAKQLARGVAIDSESLNQISAQRWNTSLRYCPRLNESECDHTSTLSGDGVLAVVWNPDARNFNGWVDIPVSITTVSVVGRNVKDAVVYPSPISTNNYATNKKSQPYTLSVQLADTTAAGFSSFVISSDKKANSAEKDLVTIVAEFQEHKNKKNHHQHHHRQPLASASSASAVHRSPSVVVGGRATKIENEFFVLNFGASGSLESMKDKISGTTISLSQDYCYLKSNIGDSICSQAGGAYIFRPVTNAKCLDISLKNQQLVFANDNHSVVELEFGGAGEAAHIIQRITVAAGNAFFDSEFTVLDVGITDGWGKELVMRYRTNVSNKNEFYTDSNGREFQWRKKDYRKYPPKPVLLEPWAQNYYPINHAIYFNDSNTRFGIVTDTSVGGGASIEEDGAIYMTVHRRLLVDDSRGVGEPLDETQYISPYAGWGPHGQHTGPPLRVRGTFRVLLESNSASFANMRGTMDRSFYKPEIFFAPAGTSAAKNIQRATLTSILSAQLPEALQLITFQMLDQGSILVRIGHKYAIDEGPHHSVPASVTLDLRKVLNDKLFKITSIERLSLSTLNKLNNNVFTATIKPQEIETFIYHLDF